MAIKPAIAATTNPTGPIAAVIPAPNDTNPGVAAAPAAPAEVSPTAASALAIPNSPAAPEAPLELIVNNCIALLTPKINDGIVVNIAIIFSRGLIDSSVNVSIAPLIVL